MVFYELLFIISCFALLGTYLAYPAILHFLSRIKRDVRKNLEEFKPSVAMITSLSSEKEGVILKTIENRKNLESPVNGLTLVYVADDPPEKIIKAINSNLSPGNIFIKTSVRKGKTNALNMAIAELNADILVFSDANSLFKKDALSKLIYHFRDPQIGGVCGELQYLDEDLSDITGKVSNLYMVYEKFIKIAESRVSSLTIFNGAIYAIRRELHYEMDISAANDFQHPLQIVLQGYKSVYEPNAVAYEDAVKNDYIEFKRTIRITARGWKGFASYIKVLNPFVTGFFGTQFVFRKLLRWLSPVFMIIALLCSLILIEKPLYFFLFSIQMVFYILALAGWFLRKRVKKKVLFFPYYFCLLNLAALIGFIYFLAGKEFATWKPSGNVS